ncbi:MAG: 50S ribosomal protein L29 [Verrucomicrobia bacterium CG_4_10_14_3_um_filter_43_23]|nr:MAG: 50S ribosomal protein L29 [Verrucomicrobia bacterium CG1_02_43_26]PIP59607.1 MAG: 50S ribosomal protein L29 [Verrucomicrobia bacterium CG22_combo_CG10-13_8_21_14_all_43_17]PIX58906.1 MAG: 50S ribosomal protein L29 [Verrucomicrobia bacterium CG_4_10_14_3_um_filter_43_23]PIY61682.1 MAG: 50S ribosomal protein L29 [Verrucomicrobia bacterium CG_4_10_14_0_8_um_filter_43_34]PJA44566.1 MAG: 50S ribosomal protein L29 [Verrucomicrobia bacterium CG_4_9_14_3_um_filter_43_20]
MKSKEIRELSREEIQSKIKECRSQLLGLRLKKQAMKIENPGKYANTRKDIARMETILREKENVSV